MTFEDFLKSVTGGPIGTIEEILRGRRKPETLNFENKKVIETAEEL